MKRLKDFHSRPEAEIALGFLQEHGITAMIIYDDAGGTHPELAFGGGVQITVADEQYEEAVKLLEEIENG